MSLTDLDIARLVAGIYAYAGERPIAWDHLDDGSKDDGVYWGVKAVDGIDVVVFRGSTTAEDFGRDAAAGFWPDRDLGPVHLGFLQGMKDVWGEVRSSLAAGAWISAGHSLGAARALILGALGVARGIPPAAIVVFGEPRPAFQKMADVLKDVPIRSYRNRDANGHDLVTDVPFHLPPIYPYVHLRPLIDVSQSPADADDRGPFRYHHAPLYVAAVAKLNPIPTIERKS